MFGKSIDEQNAIRDERAKKWEKKMEPDDNQVFYEDSIKTLVKRLRPVNGWTSQWNNTTTQSPQSGAKKIEKPPEPTIGELLRELDEIKERLFIITRDIDLEQKYPDLKEAYDLSLIHI
jgi:hypothetical protein